MADTSSPRRPTGRRFSSQTRTRLTLGSIAAAASVGLAGCDDTPPTFQDAHFTSVSECVHAGFPDRLCEGSYNAAWQNYLTTAPQFSTRQSCEADWGEEQCMERDAVSGAVSGPSTGSVFVPLLAGFVVSQALQQRYYDDDDLIYVGGGGYGSPIYRNRKGATVQLSPSNAPNAKAIARPVNVNTVTVARSGFGGKSSSRGFGG
jgi:uncharacterized protein YgiB involved in biofilm formation